MHDERLVTRVAYLSVLHSNFDPKPNRKEFEHWPFDHQPPIDTSSSATHRFH